jgi:hypothetical protein
LADLTHLSPEVREIALSLRKFSHQRLREQFDMAIEALLAARMALDPALSRRDVLFDLKDEDILGWRGEVYARCDVQPGEYFDLIAERRRTRRVA